MVQRDDQARRIPVYLLKTRSLPSDGYQDCLKSRTELPRYEPNFVPVLEHRFIDGHLARLKASVQAGDFAPKRTSLCARKYRGLIFTSQRAVEAFTRIVQELRESSISIDEVLPSTVVLYAVGPATARSLRSIDLQCQVPGEESGNGEALAHFILRHYDNSMSLGEGGADHKPGLVFLVGEQRRDVIPRTLQDESLPARRRIEVQEMVVYETGEMASFAKDFEGILAESGATVDTRWTVVFSPTGCEAMLRVLGMLDPISGKIIPTVKEQTRRTLIACIGPTTKEYLIREFDFIPDACAAQPSPQGVLEAIEGYMKSNSLHSCSESRLLSLCCPLWSAVVSVNPETDRSYAIKA